MSRLLCAIALVAIVEPASASAAGSVTGIVQDGLLHPLANATVVLHDESGNAVATTTTDTNGAFTVTVPYGAYTIEATHPGLVEDHQHIKVESAQPINVELTLVDATEVIEMTEDWSLPEPTRATGSTASVGRTALDEMPGSDTRPITSVLGTQPGFVTDALGQVYVRGTHGNIQYQVDGIPVPDSVGSMFAASIPVRLVESLELKTGGLPAEYGNRLGAVVNLVTRNAGARPVGAATVRYGSYDTVEPGVSYAAKPTDKTGVFVGGSFNYSQRALDPPSIDPILHDTGYSGRVFTRLDYQPCDCNRFEVFAMYAHNHYEIPLAPTRASGPDKYGNEPPAFVPLDTNATESEHELFGALAFTHKISDTQQLTLAPIYKLSYGKLLGDPAHALGPTADDNPSASDVTRMAHHVGGIAAYSVKSGRHELKAGAQTDFTYGHTRFASYTRDATVRGTDTTKALLSGVYAQDHITLGDASLDVGLRADNLHVMLEGGDTSTSFGVSPRAGLSYALSKDVVAHTFAGVMWIPPSPLDAANAARALGVVPADQNVRYDLKPETDLYSELGVSARLMKQVSATVTGWGRYAYNQIDDTSIGSTSLDSNYNFRRGRAAGLEVGAELRHGAWLSTFANVSLGFAQGRGIASATYLFDADALADNSWQTLDHAQTWTANAGATVRDGRFSITGQLAYGSGLRTGAANDKHVPEHLVGDISMQYTFVPSEYPIKVGVDVMNVSDVHYAYRIGNGFVGSSYAPPRTVYLSLSIPLAREPHD